MKDIIARTWKPAVILLWGMTCFVFFQYYYPNHLFYQEQNQLFLLTREYLCQYLPSSGWLSALTGDFLTQFYYYLFAGPAILTALLLLLGGILYRIFWQLGAKNTGFIATLLLITIETVFCFRYDYRLSNVVCHIGIAATLYLIVRSWRNRSCKQGARSKKHLSPLILIYNLMLLVLAYWLFGIPSTGKLTAPDFELEKNFAVDNAYYFGDYAKVEELVESEAKPNPHMLLFYNLVQAQRGLLPDKLLKYQPTELGTFYQIGPETPMLIIKDMNELYWALGDMTFTERAAMMANVFSPNNRNVRMMKRLAECNYASGDNEAAEKYLRLLDKTLAYRRWARNVRQNGETIYEQKKLFANRQDTIAISDNAHFIMMQLLDSNPDNTVALDYILCSDLLNKDIQNFKRDYDRYCTDTGKERLKDLYQQALCIWLAGTHATQEEWQRYIKHYDTMQRFAAYNQQRGSSVFSDTYWYFFDKGGNAK